MAVEGKIIEELIRKSFPDARINLFDLAGDDNHWSVEVISNDFNGKSRIKQHKMVYEALGDKMKAELHALQIKTLVKEE